MKENKFKVGDHVKKKGTTTPIMEVTSNVPGAALNVNNYVKTDKYICEWEEDEKLKSDLFEGSELELA